MEAGIPELETELLEQMALDEEMAESVWHEMMEAPTEAAIMLYLSPPEMSEDGLAEEEPSGREQSEEEEYESIKNEHGSPKPGGYEAEHEEEKSLYEKESEKMMCKEEPNYDKNEVEKYGK